MILKREPKPSTSSQGYTQSRIIDSSTANVEQLALKTKYMCLLDNFNAQDDSENVEQNTTVLSNVFETADQLFENVKEPGDMFLDARVIHMAASSLEQTAKNIEVGEGKFKLFLFAEQFKTKAYTEEVEVPFEALLSVAQPVVHNSIPYWSPLLGSFDFSGQVSTPSPKKKVRQARQRDAETQKKEPEKLNQIDKTQKGAEEIVQMIFTKLKKHYRQNKREPINYFRFVLNPTCFSSTVENIFYVSFLVNDGHVKLELENYELFISPNLDGKENSNPQSQSSSKEKKQNIVSIDKSMWKALIAELDVTEAMI